MKETGMVERRREETEMKETGVETQLVLRLFISIFFIFTVATHLRRITACTR